MPHFTFPILPAGALVDAFIGVSGGRMQALKQAGREVPQLQIVRALIDTGASGSCVDPAVLHDLGLTPTGTIQVITPTTGANPVECNQYDVSVAIPAPNGTPFAMATVAVTEHEFLNAQGFHALIGRDILARCIFHYNGQEATFTLAY
jgi:predicted aspartyl protease